MSIKNMTPREIAPTHPGEMLREDFMPDFNLTTAELAKKLASPAKLSMNCCWNAVRCHRPWLCG